MGALGVELVSPEIEGRLISSNFSGLQFIGNVQVHSLVGAVILWASRATSLQVNTQGQPPCGESTEPQESIATCEWRSIVTPYSLWKTVFLEKPLDAGGLKIRLLERGFGGRERFPRLDQPRLPVW